MKLYARLFSKILNSSLMVEAVETRFLFITMLLLANDDGVIDMPLLALARAANMPEAATRAALDRLMAPDPDSGCRDEKGCRLVPIEADRPERGWRIPSWPEYQKVLRAEHDRELGRQRIAKFRANKTLENDGRVTESNVSVTRKHTSTSSPGLPPGTEPSEGISGLGVADGSKMLLEAALAYARGGLPVLPVRDHGKDPLNRRGSRGATTSPAKIRGWWKRWPDANVAIATGEALSVVDVDGSEGEATLKGLVAEHARLPETREVRTGRGRHLWFAGNRHFRNSAKTLGPGVDTRGVGGYVVAPPSVHELGNVYTFMNPGAPLAAAPDWLVALTAKKSEKAARRYVEAALKSATEIVRDADVGQRNDALYDQARGIGRLVATGKVTSGEASNYLLNAADATGLSREEARKTIESGFNVGGAK